MMDENKERSGRPISIRTNGSVERVFGKILQPHEKSVRRLSVKLDIKKGQCPTHSQIPWRVEIFLIAFKP